VVTSGDAIGKRQPTNAGDGEELCRRQGSISFDGDADVFTAPPSGRGGEHLCLALLAVEQHRRRVTPVCETKCCRKALSWARPPAARRAPGRLYYGPSGPPGPQLHAVRDGSESCSVNTYRRYVERQIRARALGFDWLADSSLFWRGKQERDARRRKLNRQQARAPPTPIRSDSRVRPAQGRIPRLVQPLIWMFNGDSADALVLDGALG